MNLQEIKALTQEIDTLEPRTEAYTLAVVNYLFKLAKAKAEPVALDDARSENNAVWPTSGLKVFVDLLSACRNPDIKIPKNYAEFLPDGWLNPDGTICVEVRSDMFECYIPLFLKT